MKRGKGPFSHLVSDTFAKSSRFLFLAQKHRTPFYVYDEKSLDTAISEFSNAFKKHVPKLKSFYALKLNHHPLIRDRVVEKGMGLDVASRRELQMALKTPCKRIVYYSPGKGRQDLLLAIKHGERVRIHVDSFQELHLLGQLSDRAVKPVEASVRINFPNQKEWKKYGIPLYELHAFWNESRVYKNLKLNGIHFHQSRNGDSGFYVHAIEELAKYLKHSFSKEELGQIKCIDFGGGFEPSFSEGRIVRRKDSWPSSVVARAQKIETYAKDIGRAIKKHLAPLVSAEYFAEPGRYICNSAMHIVLSVADVKDEQNCILNGGVNMVGWQRFESEYFPVLNMTHPSDSEKKIHLWGNLCTTWDIWGYRIYTEKLLPGDCVVVPNQGALTYSLAQSFINKIPPVYKL